MSNTENSTMGSIGTNIPISIEEQEEDILELLCSRWQQGQGIRILEICRERDMKRREVTNLLKRMVAHGFLRPYDDKSDLELTEYGRTTGLECLYRHHNMMQFLQMVANMSEEEAEEDACRMEHVISRKGMQGISNFVRHGDVYDRSFVGTNLGLLFEDGEYAVRGVFYETDRRKPRVIARENALFAPSLRMVVRERSARFYVCPKAPLGGNTLWYSTGDSWMEAEEVEGAYSLPPELFRYTTSGRFPLMKGILAVAFTENHNVPMPRDYRELSIHLR